MNAHLHLFMAISGACPKWSYRPNKAPIYTQFRGGLVAGTNVKPGLESCATVMAHLPIGVSHSLEVALECESAAKPYEHWVCAKVAGSPVHSASKSINMRPSGRFVFLHTQKHTKINNLLCRWFYCNGVHAFGVAALVGDMAPD